MFVELSKKITTKFWFENYFAPEQLQQPFVGNDYMLVKNRKQDTVFVLTISVSVLRFLFVFLSVIKMKGCVSHKQFEIVFQITFRIKTASIITTGWLNLVWRTRNNVLHIPQPNISQFEDLSCLSFLGINGCICQKSIQIPVSNTIVH